MWKLHWITYVRVTETLEKTNLDGYRKRVGIIAWQFYIKEEIYIRSVGRRVLTAQSFISMYLAASI